LRIGQSSLKYQNPFFIIKAAPYLQDKFLSATVGYTVTKKIGKAVVRNKIKRQLRALCALLKENFLSTHAYVIIVRLAFIKLSFKEVYSQLEKSLLYLQRKSSLEEKSSVGK
jgi:ribonuclease P protein component